MRKLLSRNAISAMFQAALSASGGPLSANALNISPNRGTINEHVLLLLICNKSELLLNLKPKSRMQTPGNILNTIKTRTQYLLVLIRIFQ